MRLTPSALAGPKARTWSLPNMTLRIAGCYDRRLWRSGRQVARFSLGLGVAGALTCCSLVVDTSGLAGQSGVDAALLPTDALPPPADDSAMLDAAPDNADGALSPADAYALAVLADRPSMYLRFDEPSGTRAADVTGAHDGTCIGPVGRGVDGAFAGSKAVRFSGAQAGVDVGSIFAFEGRKPFTLEAWVKPSANDKNFRYVLGHESAGVGGRENYAIYVYDGVVQFERYVAGVGAGPSAPVPSPMSAYHHLVVTYDGDLSQLYVNGVAAGAFADAKSAALKPTSFFIGCGAQIDTFNFAGDIDDVAVYETALPASRIAAHYQVAHAP